jgi:uncharacterized protein with von Willebrand factor type A (vWA) domain
MMLFQAFFDRLRAEGVPVSWSEWLMLLEALDRGAAEPDLESFYRLARAVLVKDEAFYDRFDRAFVIAFKDAEPPADVLERVLAGLQKELARTFSEEEMKALQALPLEQVLANFRKQLAEGHYKGHVGGNKAIGTRGTSTQGADGYNPAGIRIGQDEGRHGRAIKIAEFRRFRNYDSRRALDTRGMRVALSRLRRLQPEGPADQLDLPATIDRTAREGGELSLVMRPRRRNVRRILLMTDVGGSMSGFADIVGRFFSAMTDEVRDLRHVYFHNCVYDKVWNDATRHETVPTSDLIERYRATHDLVLVGDAAMAPTELTHVGGVIDLYDHNPRPGLATLQDLRTAFPRAVWLNPEPERNWDVIWTIRMVREVFPMYPLTTDGIVAAVGALMRRRAA